MKRFIALLTAAVIGLAVPAVAADSSKTPPAASKGPAPGKTSTPDEMLDAMIKNMDKDGDGKINKEEFLAAPTKAFEMRDSDKDGFLSRSEMMPGAPQKGT